MDYKPIKRWDAEDRPREKLMLKGVASLSDSEIIAILLRSGSRRQSAVDVGRNLLHAYKNNLNELSKASINELCRFPGIGEAKAISIIAALELGRRRKMAEVLERKTIASSTHAFEIFDSLIRNPQHEEFWCLFLNRANEVLEKYRISQGGTTGTVMDIKLLIRRALERYAQGLIVAHNHPSGNLRPSAPDRDITSKIKEAAGMFDIKLLDHIILGENNYFSFADEGLLEE